MFNTTILDVAIGMIFIYLLLSLMCTAANEIIELMLKKRAIDLERGIRELLDPESASKRPLQGQGISRFFQVVAATVSRYPPNPGAANIVQDLYNHPLVNGLFGGRYEHSGIANWKRWWKRTDLPSYIPARNFSLALMDLILPGGGAVGSSGATGALAGPLPPTVPAQVVVNVAASAETAAVPPEGGAETGGDPSQSPNANPSLIALRDALLKSQLPDQIKQGLVPLLDAAGNDVARARENIEGWYNASMDRVSSWYKRRAQVTILILGLFVAVAVNADSIAIGRRLATDRPLRESLVAAADKYAQANATSSPIAAATASPTASPTPCPTPAAEPPACKSDANSDACQHDKELQKNVCACALDITSEECKLEAQIQKIGACVKDRNSPECRYQATQLQLRGLGLPIGWDSAIDGQSKWPGLHFWQKAFWRDWLTQTRIHIFGWLLTALAISLGAPFWFDLLNKFIVIRSAVKPHEKSPEEGSKD